MTKTLTAIGKTIVGFLISWLLTMVIVWTVVSSQADDPIWEIAGKAVIGVGAFFGVVGAFMFTLAWILE